MKYCEVDFLFLRGGYIALLIACCVTHLYVWNIYRQWSIGNGQ